MEGENIMVKKRGAKLTKNLPPLKKVLNELHELYLKEKEVLDKMNKRDDRADWKAKIQTDKEFTLDDWKRVERILAEQEAQERGLNRDDYHN